MVLMVPLPRTVVFSIARPSRESIENSGTNRSVKSSPNRLRSAVEPLPARCHSSASRTLIHAYWGSTSSGSL